jgi:hypothetical protein
MIVRTTDSCTRGGHSYFPPKATFAATAVLHFDGPEGTPTRLELLNPLTITQVEIQGRPLPLAADLTTPLARLVAGEDLLRLDYLGFLRANRLNDRRGIHMVEPYERGKIPVILIHGLLSGSTAALTSQVRPKTSVGSRWLQIRVGKDTSNLVSSRSRSKVSPLPPAARANPAQPASRRVPQPDPVQKDLPDSRRSQTGGHRFRLRVFQGPVRRCRPGVGAMG